MFYLAMILTFLGLLLILLYIVQSSVQRPRLEGAQTGRQRLNLPSEGFPEEESAAPTWHLRSRKRDAWREDPSGEGERGEDTEKSRHRADESDDSVGKRGVHLRRLETGTTEETMRIKPWALPAEQEAPIPPLVVGGTLYLNRNRNLPLPGTVFQNNIRAFGELKRIGNGTLVLEGGGFLIRCGAASYHYSAGDLEQIIFQNRGLALIPALPDRPVPVFITEQPQVIKEYIKKHARILH